MKKGFSLPKYIRWTFFACIAGPALIVACLTILIFCGACLILRKDPFDYIDLEGFSDVHIQKISKVQEWIRSTLQGWRKRKNIWKSAPSKTTRQP